MIKPRIINSNYKDGLHVNIGDRVTIISHPDYLATPHVGRTGVVIDQWNAKHYKHWRVDIDDIERVLSFDYHELYRLDLDTVELPIDRGCVLCRMNMDVSHFFTNIINE